MRKLFLPAIVAQDAFSSAPAAKGKKIGVSRSNFQEPRWTFDAAAMRSSIRRDGNQYATGKAAGLLANGVTMDRVPDSIRFCGGEKGLPGPEAPGCPDSENARLQNKGR